MDEDDKGLPKGNFISLPNGEQVTPEELGADFVLGSSDSNFKVPELVDSSDAAKGFREREEFVAKQPLVKAINDKHSSVEVVDQLVKEIAEELSHLKYERQRAAKEGKNTTNITVNRIASLRQLADVLLKRMENARAEQLNLKSPRFREVLKLWMEFVYESMQKTNLADEVIDLVFRQMEADMIDWEKRVSEL